MAGWVNMVEESCFFFFFKVGDIWTWLDPEDRGWQKERTWKNSSRDGGAELSRQKNQTWSGAGKFIGLMTIQPGEFMSGFSFPMKEVKWPVERKVRSDRWENWGAERRYGLAPKDHGRESWPGKLIKLEVMNEKRHCSACARWRVLSINIQQLGLGSE